MEDPKPTTAPEEQEELTPEELSKVAGGVKLTNDPCEGGEFHAK